MAGDCVSSTVHRFVEKGRVRCASVRHPPIGGGVCPAPISIEHPPASSATADGGPIPTSYTEHFITLNVEPTVLPENIPSIVATDLSDFLNLQKTKGTVVSIDIFGCFPGCGDSQLLTALETVCGVPVTGHPLPTPTWVYPITEEHHYQGSGENGHCGPGNGASSPLPLCLQFHLVDGTETTAVKTADGVVVGMTWNTHDGKFLRIGGLVASNDISRVEQCQAVLEGFATILHLHQMKVTDIARTWYFVDDLLNWYHEFNAARDAWFTKHKIFDHIVPASTCIGGPNVHGTAIIGGLLAVRPHNTTSPKLQPSSSNESIAFSSSSSSSGLFTALPSPLSCSALKYGSSFSRAVDIRLDRAATSHVLVSGTASVAPDGSTLYIDDIEKQIERTMETVAAIMRQRHAEWQHIVRMIVYVRRKEYLLTFHRWLREHRLTGHTWPVAVAHNVVCRDDFLFEVECDAIVSPVASSSTVHSNTVKPLPQS